jgi:hypothetical protein
MPVAATERGDHHKVLAIPEVEQRDSVQRTGHPSKRGQEQHVVVHETPPYPTTGQPVEGLVQ